MALFKSLCVILFVAAFSRSGLAQISRISCPNTKQSARQALQSCTSISGFAANPTGRPTSFSDIKKHCGMGHFEQTLTCLDGLIQSCKTQNRTISDELEANVDVRKLRAAYHLLCANQDNQDLLGSARCMDGKFDTLKACINTKMITLNEEMAGKPGERQTSQNIAEFYRSTCDLYDNVYHCYEQKLRLNCGDRITDVYMNLPRAFKPPYCWKYQDGARNYPGEEAMRSSAPIAYKGNTGMILFVTVSSALMTQVF